MHAGRFAQRVEVERPGQIRPAAESLIRRYVSPWVRLLFRPRLDGVEKLPESGPYLLVTNHSAGVGLAEILSVVVCWLENPGASRRLAGFALPLGFVVWPFSSLHRQLGTIPSTYAAGRAALKSGVPLLVFPGGDHESLKPVWRNGQVDFAGRVGFLRLARELGVPVVPMGIRNGAWTAPIVMRGKWLSWVLVAPRLMGVKRWGVSALAVAVSVAMWWGLPWDGPWKLLAIWLWLGSPLTFLPIVPATIRMRIGDPIPASTLFPEDDEATLRAALGRVEGAVQDLVRGEEGPHG